MKNEKSFFSSNILIIIIVLLIVVSFIMWKFIKSTEQFGLNFFATMIGVALTVFVIDKLIKKGEEEQRIPQRVAAYLDIRRYTNEIITFWIDTFIMTVNEKDAENLNQFFTENMFEKIFNKINLTASVPRVNNYPTMADWIIQHIKNTNNEGDKILFRYSYNLEPETFKSIHQLTTSFYFSFLLQLIYGSTSNETICSYNNSVKKEKEINAILQLQKWCEKSYPVLQKYENDLPKPPYFNPVNERKWIQEGDFTSFT